MPGCRALSTAEITAIEYSFEGAFSQRNILLFKVMRRTGFRVSEALSIKIEDVFQRGQVLRSVKVDRENMKGKHFSRSVPLHDEVRKAISDYIVEFGNPEPGAYLFRSRQGGNRPITRVQAYRVFKAAYRKCKLLGKTGCHSTRKTFAETVYKALGNDLYKLQKAMGHACITSTTAYISVDGQSIEDAILGL